MCQSSLIRRHASGPSRVPEIDRGRIRCRRAAQSDRREKDSDVARARICGEPSSARASFDDLSQLLEALDNAESISNSDEKLIRDHRPRMCNSDDYYRITQVPKGPGKNFRDMPGVIETSKGTCCAGHTHAFIGHGCPGGGTAPLPKRSVHKESRIDHADKDGWRGLELKGCPSRTVFTPTMNLVCPRWCITYKNGLSSGRHGCFGRIRLNSVQPTVVTRAEPHNLEICHPYQDRVLSIREMARCQVLFCRRVTSSNLCLDIGISGLLRIRRHRKGRSEETLTDTFKVR